MLSRVNVSRDTYENKIGWSEYPRKMHFTCKFHVFISQFSQWSVSIWNLSPYLDFLRSKTNMKCLYSIPCDFWSWSYCNVKYRTAAILNFTNMAAPATFGFGALKKWNHHILSYMCAKFHACRQMCTIPPCLFPKGLDLYVVLM